MKSTLKDILILGVGIVIAFVGAATIDPGMLFLLCEVLVLFFMAQMWNLLAGYGGQVSMGHQAFVGMGAYVLFVLANNTSISPWIILALVPFIIGLLALPLGAAVFRLKHAYFSIGMWVIAEFIQTLVIKTEVLGGSSGIVLRPGGNPLKGDPERAVFFIAVVACFALMIGLRRLLNAPIGLALLSVRDNEAAAESAGINVRKLHLQIFSLSAAGCAGAGALYYMTVLYLSPMDGFQINWVVAMMFICVVGGMGTLTGPFVGTLIFVGLRETMTAFDISGGRYWIVMGVIAVATLLFAPRGLWPFHQSLFAKGK